MIDKVLTKQIAEQFINNSDGIDLADYNVIDENAAEQISKYKKKYLGLGITSINENIAKSLSKYKGSTMEFFSLEYIDENSAAELKNFQGELHGSYFTLKKDKKITRGTLIHLSQCKQRFNHFLRPQDWAVNLFEENDDINITKSLVQFIAEVANENNDDFCFYNLEQYKSIETEAVKLMVPYYDKTSELILSSIEELNVETAKAMIPFECYLELTGLKKIKPELADVLIQFESNLWLDYEDTQICDESKNILSNRSKSIDGMDAKVWAASF